MLCKLLLPLLLRVNGPLWFLPDACALVGTFLPSAQVTQAHNSQNIQDSTVTCELTSHPL